MAQTAIKGGGRPQEIEGETSQAKGTTLFSLERLSYFSYTDFPNLNSDLEVSLCIIYFISRVDVF